MMQGFYLLAMQQARRRTLLAALACIAALISIVLAGRALSGTYFTRNDQSGAGRTRAAVRACRSGERSNQLHGAERK